MGFHEQLNIVDSFLNKMATEEITFTGPGRIKYVNWRQSLDMQGHSLVEDRRIMQKKSDERKRKELGLKIFNMMTSKHVPANPMALRSCRRSNEVKEASYFLPPECMMLYSKDQNAKVEMDYFPVHDQVLSGFSSLMMEEIVQYLIVCPTCHGTYDVSRAQGNVRNVGLSHFSTSEPNMLQLAWNDPKDELEMNPEVELFSKNTGGEYILLDLNDETAVSMGVSLKSYIVARDFEHVSTSCISLSKYAANKNERDEVHNELYVPSGEAPFYFSTHEVHMCGQIITIDTCILSSFTPTGKGEKPDWGVSQTICTTILQKTSLSGNQLTVICTSDDMKDLGILRSLDKITVDFASETFAFLFLERHLRKPRHFLMELKSAESPYLLKKEMELLPFFLASTSKEFPLKEDHKEPFHVIDVQQTCESTTLFEFKDNHTIKHFFGKLTANALRQSHKLGDIADISFGNNSLEMIVLSPLNARITLWIKGSVINLRIRIVGTEPKSHIGGDCAKKVCSCDCSVVRQFFHHVMDSVCPEGELYKCQTAIAWCPAIDSARDPIMMDNGKTSAVPSWEESGSIVSNVPVK